MYSVLILFYFIFLTRKKVLAVLIVAKSVLGLNFSKTSPHDLSVVTCTKHKGDHEAIRNRSWKNHDDQKKSEISRNL